MNKVIKIFVIFFLFLSPIAIYFFVYQNYEKRESVWKNAENISSNEKPFFEVGKVIENVSQENNITTDLYAIENAAERITKKHFGIFINPENSPVQPENFYGYHTGVDFEIFEDENNKSVDIFFVCDGKILEKRFASGYGGFLVQLCNIEDNSVTIVYGHLDLKSITKTIGDEVSRGEKVGILGKGFSSETDGERKHLHLGIHKGMDVNISGYVQNKKDLSDWIDPCEYFCKQ